MRSKIFGREDELVFLERQYEIASRGKGGAILISGSQGIGKTRLMEEFVDTIEMKRDGVALIGRCSQKIIQPLSPFLNSLKGHDGGIVDEIEGSVMEKTDVFKRLFAKFSDLSKRENLLLVIEDIHWADSLSLEFINYFIRNIINYNILLIMTFRTETAAVNKESMISLNELRKVMSHEPALLELELHGLAPTDIASIATSRKGILAGSTIKFLQESSAGNPLYTKEWVAYLEENGLINDEGALSGSFDELGQLIPTTIREVILGRFNVLRREQRSIFENGAIIGPTFNIEWLEPLTGMSAMNMMAELEEVNLKHDLLMVDGKNVSFYHETIWRVLYDSIPHERRRELHLKLADWLSDPDRSVPDTIICDQYEMGGDEERTKVFAHKAANALMSKFAVKEAEHYFALAIASDPTEDDVWNSCVEGYADTLFEQGDYERAISLFEKRLAKAAYDDRARLLLKLADCWAPMRYGKGSRTRYKELLDEVASIADKGPEEEGEFWSDMSAFHSSSDQIEASLECRRRSIESFRTTTRWDKTAWELTCLGVQVSYYGHPCQGLKHLMEAFDIYRVHSRTRGEEFAHMAYGEVLMSLGMLDESAEHITIALELSKEIGEHYETIFGHYFLSMINLMRFDYENSLAHAIVGVEMAERLGYDMFACMPGWEVVISYLMMGDIENASGVYHDLMDVYERPSTGVATQLKAFMDIVTFIMDMVGREEYDLERFMVVLNAMQGKQNENLNKGFFLFLIGIILDRSEMAGAEATLKKAKEEFLKICDYPMVAEVDRLLDGRARTS